jgi:nucleoside-diphosphate-sugar epimerase
VVFNLAGYGIDRTETDPRLAEAINRDLVSSLLRVVPVYRDPAWRGPNLVHTGSALEYGAVGGNLDERTKPNPTTVYGRTKLAATLAIEAAAAAGRCWALTARLFTVYGPGEHEGRLMPTVLSARRASSPIPMTDGLQRRDFTFVKDVGAGLLRAAAADRSGPMTFNLATGKLLSVREFVLRTAEALGIDSRMFVFGALPQRPDEMAHEAIAIERLMSFLQWVPTTSVEAAAVETAAWGD